MRRERLSGRGSSRKARSSWGGWQQANRIQVDPSDELPIRGEARRADVHLAQLPEDGLVDQVVGWRCAIVCARKRIYDAELGSSHFPHGASRDRRQPGSASGERPVRRQLGDRFTARKVADLIGHVARAPVGQATDRDQPLLGPGADKDALARMQFQSLELRTSSGEGRSLPQPAQNGLVFLGIDRQQASAAVGNLERRLAKQQALLRAGEIHSAPFMRRDDHLVVGRDVVSEERQLESVLARRRAVAGGTVAPLQGENRDDVRREADRHFTRTRTDTDLALDCEGSEPDADPGSSRGARHEPVLSRIHGDHGGIRRDDLAFPRDFGLIALRAQSSD